MRSFATLARRDRNAAAEQLKQDLAELGQDGLMDLQNAIWADAACFMAEVSDDEVKVDPEEAANALKQPEIRFFVTVVLPCFLVYREHPTRMMHLARLGDEVALERLLRIDKYVLHEPRIRNHVVESAYARSPRRFTRLVRAIGGRAEGKMDDRTMKVRLASAITKPLAAMKIEINEPQVRGSFDLAAKVQGRGVDKDLPPSPESLSKALQRERKLWHPRLSDKS